MPDIYRPREILEALATVFPVIALYYQPQHGAYFEGSEINPTNKAYA